MKIPFTSEKRITQHREGVYVVGFKIFYKDDSIYVAKDVDLKQAWDEAPVDGVLLVLLYENTGDRVILAGDDFYCYDGEEFSTSFDDSRVLEGIIKNGKWTTDEHMARVNTKAMNDITL